MFARRRFALSLKNINVPEMWPKLGICHKLLREWWASVLINAEIKILLLLADKGTVDTTDLKKSFLKRVFLRKELQNSQLCPESHLKALGLNKFLLGARSRKWKSVTKWCKEKQVASELYRRFHQYNVKTIEAFFCVPSFPALKLTV